jgi:glutathione S-transferase
MTTTGPIRLFDYPASCNCYKVRLLLSQLGIEYERVGVDIFAGETLTPEYAAINPERTTPVLQTADGDYLPDSGAILAHLAAGTEYLPERALGQIVRWLIYEQLEVVPAIGGLRFRLLTGRLGSGDREAIDRRKRGAGVLELLDAHLRAHEFMAGDRYTIADIAIYGYTHRAGEAGYSLDPHAALRSWLERVERRPGYIEDVEPYGANAAPGAGSSIYDG